MLKIEKIQHEKWYKEMSQKERNEFLQCLDVGSNYIPIATEEQNMAETAGQMPQCIMNTEDLKGLSQRVATMNGDIFGHDGRGGIFKDLDEIKESCRRTETTVNQLTQELITDRAMNKGKFEQIENDVHGIGEKVRTLETKIEEAKVKIEEAKVTEVDRNLEEIEKTKAFWYGIIQKVVIGLITTAGTLIIVGIKNGGL